MTTAEMSAETFALTLEAIVDVWLRKGCDVSDIMGELEDKLLAMRDAYEGPVTAPPSDRAFAKGSYAMREHIALILRLAGHEDLSAATLITELPDDPAKVAALDHVRFLLAMDDDRPGIGGKP